MEQDIPGTVERPATRHNMTIDETKAYRLLQDPIDFAQNMGRALWCGELQPILMNDVPDEVDDVRSEFESLLDMAIERGEATAIQDVFIQYTEFVTGALGDAREYGIAEGVVLEQLRVGLLEISDLKQRGMTYVDGRTRNDMTELRRKYNLAPSDQALKYAAGVASQPTTSSEGEQAAD